ncbi:hypothetical protein ACHAXR_007366 [Thalassiosira sp. AJA248-18]
MDANEDVQHGAMCKQLRGDDLQMMEAVETEATGMAPKTWFRGKDAIDGRIWVSSDIDIIGASYLPFDAEIGDHRPVVVDFTVSSVLGANFRLNSKVGRIRDAYIERLEGAFKEHGIYEKLLSLQASASYPASAEAEAALKGIDKLMTSLMLEVEKKCQKLNLAHYDFSPVVKSWLDKFHAYRQLTRLRSGKAMSNVANVKRFAVRNGIEKPLHQSLEQLVDSYRDCKEQTKRLLAELPWLRKQYLHAKLQDALDQGKDEDAGRLKEILRNEAQKREWQGIHRVTKPRGVTSVTRVEVPQSNGAPIKCTTKETVEDGIHLEPVLARGQCSDLPRCFV